VSDKQIFYGVIPARLGSRRLSRKNLAPLLGKPLVQHSIEFACKHLPPDRVVLSSDAEEILAIGAPFGIHCLKRPEELAGDTSTTGETARHAVMSVFKNINEEDGVFIFQPTTPWRPDTTIVEFERVFAAHGGDTVVSVSPSGKKLGFVDGAEFKPINYVFEGSISAARNLFFENGMLFLASWGTLRDGRVFSDRVVPMPIDDDRIVDIDTELDLQSAEFLLRNRT
jgi:N-acylneuraminate cytidylyltransferase